MLKDLLPLFTTSRRAKVLVVSCLVWLSAGSAAAQTTQFTYQGNLSDSGSPASGSHDFQFRLFDTATVGAGTQHGPTLTRANVTVSSGRFSVQLDFGACASCFDGADRFLEISVKRTSDPTYTTLSPRQQINSAPYALRSAAAAAADSLSVTCVNCVTSSQIGSVSGSAVTGAIPVASVPAGSTDYIQNTTSPQASSNFNISGNGVVGGALGIGTATPAGLLHVRGASPVRILGDITTLAGSESVDFFARTSSDIGGMRIQRNAATGDIDTLIFASPSGSSATERMRVAGNGNVGIGTTSPDRSLTVRRNGGAYINMRDANFSDGPHELLVGADSNGGIVSTITNEDLQLRAGGNSTKMIIKANGNIGIGLPSPAYKVDIGDRIRINNGASGSAGIWFHQFTGIGSFEQAFVGMQDTSNVGFFGNTGAGWSLTVNTTSGLVSANAGILGSSNTGVGVYGVSVNGNDGVVGESHVANRSGVYGFTTHAEGCGGCFENRAGGLALGVTGTARVNGTASVIVLEITGGADLAERFAVGEGVKPGMVVAIDPANAGALSMAHGAYNRRVAGVISGAKNLSAGLVLPNLSGAKQSMPVALSGRVWVLCDAMRNPIKPGDLLTTSFTPGHAMKVMNRAKAQGAIIGKAMTDLKAGRGLVLVLVSLQ